MNKPQWKVTPWGWSCWIGRTMLTVKRYRAFFPGNRVGWLYVPRPSDVSPAKAYATAAKAKRIAEATAQKLNT